MLKQRAIRLIHSICLQHHIHREALVWSTIILLRFQISLVIARHIKVSSRGNRTVVRQTRHLEVVGGQQTVGIDVLAKDQLQIFTHSKNAISRLWRSKQLRTARVLDT